LIDEKDGMGALRHLRGDIGEISGHRLGVAGRQDEARAFAVLLGKWRRRCRWMRYAGLKAPNAALFNCRRACGPSFVRHAKRRSCSSSKSSEV
jgi:hypothetical protein